MQLSAIFLNPSDMSFSALRFLELLSSQRPAIPVFLIEASLASQVENQKKVLELTHTQGVFKGDEPFAALMESLKTNIDSPDTVRTKIPDHVQKTGYSAVPIGDFFTGSLYLYNIFIQNKQGYMNLFGQNGSPIDATLIAKAMQDQTYLYIKEEELSSVREGLRNARTLILESSEFPISWKTAETMVSAKNILNEMKQAGVNDQMIDYAQTMLGDLFKLVSKIEHDAGSLHKIIDQAKQCDRSVFCASYSMLICKHLKFEKTATLEILGLASILQDISLFKTQFGDLTGMQSHQLTSEQLILYQQHPALSADLIASHTDIPQVTLQVVRQHHERKDKTGFPSRVGGNQLHPMAEILSLINSYYDITLNFSDDAAIIQELQRSVFPHYSPEVIAAFKSVLGNILKDKIHSSKVL